MSLLPFELDGHIKEDTDECQKLRLSKSILPRASCASFLRLRPNFCAVPYILRSSGSRVELIFAVVAGAVIR